MTVHLLKSVVLITYNMDMELGHVVIEKDVKDGSRQHSSFAVSGKLVPLAMTYGNLYI